MCQQCLDAARRYFPQVADDEIYGLLIGSTAFPFAEPAQVERQLAEMSELGITTLEGALAYGDEVTTKAEREFRERAECERIMRL